MTGDVWLLRQHRGPGFLGWLGEKFAGLITLVRPGEHTKYNHVALSIGDGKLLEARNRGVVETDERVYLESTRHTLAIYRPIGYSGDDLAEIYRVASTWVGIRYSWPTVFAHLFGRRFAAWVAKLSKDKICSELVARIYYDAVCLRFWKRLSRTELEPEAVRPRDVEFTVERSERWTKTFEADLRQKSAT